MSKNQNGNIIGIRLTLCQNREDDQPIFNYFQEIKTELGLKKNTEVARYCIKKAYECIKKEKNESVNHKSRV